MPGSAQHSRGLSCLCAGPYRRVGPRSPAAGVLDLRRGAVANVAALAEWLAPVDAPDAYARGDHLGLRQDGHEPAVTPGCSPETTTLTRHETKELAVKARLLSLAVGLMALLGLSAIPAAAATAPLSIPNQLESAINVDKVHHTATLPLYKGEFNDQRVWYVITESSDLHEAVRLGVNWAPKLVNALGTAAVQSAKLHGRQLDRTSVVDFSGTVDFSGQRVVLPGPDEFPVLPGTHAGPIADANYSPLFTLGNGIVYDGEQIANWTGVHPKVLSLDVGARHAILRLTEGRYLGRQVLYLSTESSLTQVAALENATYAPNLAAAPQAGSDDPNRSAREAIIPIVNGPRGVDNPQRQGLQSAVAGEGDPLNIIREEPECSDPTVPANCSALQYSPLWDVTPVAWTQAAIDAGLRVRVESHETVEQLFDEGLLVNFNPTGPSQDDPEILGLRALGAVVNCPPIFVALP